MGKLDMYLVDKCRDIRHKTYAMCCKAGTGHITSCFSCAEIMVALFYEVMRHRPSDPTWDGRDIFILSKGQASPIYYAILADMGYFPSKDLDTFCRVGGKMGVHLQHSVPGVEFTTGSLGIGLSMGVGWAYGLKLKRKQNLVFVLLGDGELQEGQVWEALMSASQYRLNNLIAIIDRNALNATDFTEQSVGIEPLQAKLRAFNWGVREIAGNDICACLQGLEGVRSRKTDRPLAIIAQTRKGEGIESICDDPAWHACCPKGNQVDELYMELVDN